DYLAKRDARWMGPVYEFLGLSVASLYHDMPVEERRAAYRADITYGTNNEFGFDYLRDNMADDAEGMVQRGHYYAIVDEVDSVLIDESRTPLIISGPTDSDSSLYVELNPRVANLVKRQKSIVNRYLKEAEEALREGDREEAGRLLLQAEKGDPRNKRLLELKEDPDIIRLIQKTEFYYNQSKSISQIEEELYFVLEEKGHAVTLTEKGRNALSPSNPEKLILHDYTDRIAELDHAGMPTEELVKQKEKLEAEYLEASERIHIINQLLRAYSLYENNVEYVVQDGRVIIVDEFTGRLMPGRRYGDGLHQAIEAKENVPIERDTQTLATITIQNYFRMYEKLAGMTGTAETEAEEFSRIYGLDVIVIPTNEPVIRRDYADRIYRTGKEKWTAIADEIEECHRRGQPVLVGTISVDKSELLSKILKKRHIPHQILNAKYHEKEAQIIAQAGQKHAVTIATNMAGRGTDIKLGEGVVELGGLHIIGTERHEARRIDNQLRGRSGRQGDPGSSRFYLSLEDDLMRLFGSDRISGIMQRMGLDEGQNIDSPMVSKAISSAQKKVENRNFEIRKRLLKYDNVMNDQRGYVYGRRSEFLTGEDIEGAVQSVLEEVVDARLEQLDLPRGGISAAELEPLRQWLQELLLEEPGLEIDGEMGLDELRARLVDLLKEQHRRKVQELGEDIAPRVQRFLAVRAIDRRWKEHLYAMDGMREGIGYQSYAQKDPLIEYKFQAFNLFRELIQNINDDIVKNLFRVRMAPALQRSPVWNINQVRHDQVGQFSRARAAARAPAGAEPARAGSRPAGAPAGASAASSPGPAPRMQVVAGSKVGRNDPCPCGSGKKYKYCCGR
ncbi:MAG: preprotein translocase subunit SecA, partial [Spirochaetota bacterium]